MTTTLADARAAVLAARRRLVAAAAAEGAAAGALYGAAAGVALVLVGLVVPDALPSAPWAWLLSLPVATATVGAALAVGRAPSFVGAALALDRAAGTQEAFVSSLSADDAPPAFRELAAENALARCSPGGVPRFLPLTWPRRARGAVVSVALLAAVVMVGGPDGSASAAPGRSFLPPQHVLVPGRAGSDAPREDPRQDLRQADEERLRQAAEALLATKGSEEAERALAALAAGDRATALLELENALERVSGAQPAGSGPSSDGASDPATAPTAGDTPAPWSAGSWPLRYDRVVDRWLELERKHEEDR